MLLHFSFMESNHAGLFYFYIVKKQRYQTPRKVRYEMAKSKAHRMEKKNCDIPDEI